MIADTVKRVIKTVIGTFGLELRRLPLAPIAPKVRRQEGYEATASTPRIQEYVAVNKTVKLHVGCGPRILKGWVNIDLEYEPYDEYLRYYTDVHYSTDVRGEISEFFAFDVRKCPLPIRDASIDVVFHEDFIEHLNQRDQFLFLAEMLRVLKPGAVHRVNTPNLCVSMETNSNFRNGYVGVYADEWDRHGHHCVFTPTALEEAATLVGYSKVIFNARDKSVSPLIPLEYRPDPNDRPEGGNIHADLIK